MALSTRGKPRDPTKLHTQVLQSTLRMSPQERGESILAAADENRSNPELRHEVRKLYGHAGVAFINSGVENFGKAANAFEKAAEVLEQIGDEGAKTLAIGNYLAASYLNVFTRDTSEQSRLEGRARKLFTGTDQRFEEAKISEQKFVDSTRLSNFKRPAA